MTEKGFIGGGWSLATGYAIYVGHLPGRKQIALYTELRGVEITVLAYFRTPEAARETLDWMDRLAASTRTVRR